MPETREDSVYLAKLAEQAERYEGGFLCLGGPPGIDHLL
jgi:hypothetical protein